MLGSLKYNYILFFFSVLFLDMIFPIYLPYVKILIVTNVMLIFTLTRFRLPSKEFMLFLVIIALFVISACLSNSMYDYLYRDLANIILVLTFFPIYCSEIRHEESFFNFKRKLFYALFLTGGIVSIIGLYKFILLSTSGTQISYFVMDEGGEDKFRLGTSLVGDYNYYAYGLFVSLLTIPILLEKKQALIWKIILSGAFLLLSFNIFFSSSRRGVILLSVYFLILLIKFLFKRRKTISQKISYILTIIFGLVILASIIRLLSSVITGLSGTSEFDKLWERIQTSSDSESMGAGRFVRIDEGLRIFSEYNPFQLFFGGGFDYLSRIGRLTYIEEDYPHNFLISALLYGGILAVVLTIIFVWRTIIQYLRNAENLNLFFVWFLFGVFMIMTSKNSIFSVQFIVLLFLLPYNKFLPINKLK